jgi:hypothetical protein
MTQLRIEEVEKLCLSHAGLLEGYRRGLLLQEKGWVLYPAVSWDKPAVLAFDGDQCVAGVNWDIDDTDNEATVRFAWCRPTHPRALLACFMRLRHLLRKANPTSVTFIYHEGNDQMARLVVKLGMTPFSHRYRVPPHFYTKATPPPPPRWKELLLKALKGLEAKLT